MKYLEAKALANRPPQQQNKMLSGSRPDQMEAPMPPALHEHAGRTIRADVLKWADELGVDLETVTGTGKNGEILVRDVRARKQTMDQSDPKNLISAPPSTF